MIRITNLLFITIDVYFSGYVMANNTYEEIAKRHSEVAFGTHKVLEAKMEGECLVGLKELNFKKKDEFDPVAEWTSYRTSPLLEQFSPCQVLIIMEVAQGQLKKASR